MVLAYGEGRIIRAKDPLGREWGYGYEVPAGGLSGPVLSTVTDPLGQVMRYVYTSSGALQKVIDRRGNVVKVISYDDGGRVGQQEFVDGGVERYEYSLSGTVITGVKVTDPLGRVTTKRFNASGYVIEETDGLGQKTNIDRDLTVNLAKSTSGPCGCVQVTNVFNSAGNPLTRTDRLANDESYEYDPVFQNPTKYTDKLGKTTLIGYDPNGNLTSVIRAAGGLNLTTLLGYDSFGELTSVKDPLGHETRFEYDANGNMTARIDPLNNRTTFEYDLVGRSTKATDALGRATVMTYNQLFVTDVTDPSGAMTHIAYDPNGNRTAVADTLQNQWSYSYDVKNRNEAATDPLGRMTKFSFNLDNELTKALSPSGREVSYTYDDRGMITSITDPGL